MKISLVHGLAHFIKRNLFSDKFVTRRYLYTGGNFGDAVSYAPVLGECVGFEELLNRWAKWEKEYAERGYRTVSLDDFIEYGGYGKPIDKLVGVKRQENEDPVLHAETYRRVYLGSIQPVLDMKRLLSPD